MSRRGGELPRITKTRLCLTGMSLELLPSTCSSDDDGEQFAGPAADARPMRRLRQHTAHIRWARRRRRDLHLCGLRSQHYGTDKPRSNDQSEAERRQRLIIHSPPSSVSLIKAAMDVPDGMASCSRASTAPTLSESERFWLSFHLPTSRVTEISIPTTAATIFSM